MGKKRLFQLLGPDPEITTASGVLELREPLGLIGVIEDPRF